MVNSAKTDSDHFRSFLGEVDMLLDILDQEPAQEHNGEHNYLKTVMVMGAPQATYNLLRERFRAEFGLPA